MKLDVELTEAEYDWLVYMLGMATGTLIGETRSPEMAKKCVQLINKLLAVSPAFVPYDENSFDAAAKYFPFKTVTKQ